MMPRIGTKTVQKREIEANETRANIRLALAVGTQSSPNCPLYFCVCRCLSQVGCLACSLSEQIFSVQTPPPEQQTVVYPHPQLSLPLSSNHQKSQQLITKTHPLAT